MSESSAQICEAVIPWAMTSLLTKLSVVPGKNFVGQVMADCVGFECWLAITVATLDNTVSWKAGKFRLNQVMSKFFQVAGRLEATE